MYLLETWLSHLKSFYFYFRLNKRMALEPRKLWVTRLKESTTIDVIRDTFSTNASKVLKVTMVSGGSGWFAILSLAALLT